MKLDSDLANIPSTATDDGGSHAWLDVVLIRNRVVLAFDRGVLGPRSTAVSVGLVIALSIQADVHPGANLPTGIESIVCMGRTVGAQVDSINDCEIN